MSNHIEFDHDAEAKVIATYKHIREEERYEVGIVSGRLSSLLASQSLLFTAWAILHGPTEELNEQMILRVLAVVGAVICLSAIAAVWSAIVVIRRWQIHGASIVSKNDRILNHYCIGRSPNDWYHFLGVVLFSLAVPVLFLSLWVFLFCR